MKKILPAHIKPNMMKKILLTAILNRLAKAELNLTKTTKNDQIQPI